MIRDEVRSVFFDVLIRWKALIKVFVCVEVFIWILLICFSYGFSVEEAKKKIYACSTTTYNGFQVQVSEEVSKKFEG